MKAEVSSAIIRGKCPQLSDTIAQGLMALQVIITTDDLIVKAILVMVVVIGSESQIVWFVAPLAVIDFKIMMRM